MKNKIIALVALAACFCAPGQSRGEALPATARPTVKLPQNGKWTIQFSLRDAPTPSPSPGQRQAPKLARTKSLKSIDVTANANPELRREIVHWSDGSSTELWKIQGAWYCAADRNQVIGLNSFGGGNFVPYWKSFTAGEFLRIVSSGTGILTTYYSTPALLYTGVHKENGTNYIPPSPDSKTGNGSAPVFSTPEGLFVNPQTSYPIAYYNLLAVYAFNNITDGLTEKLVPPPTFAGAARSAADEAYIARPPRRP
jgi:hypothetical protein